MYDPPDADAPTLLTYAPTPWIRRRDEYGALLDDDCDDCGDELHSFITNDPDADFNRWIRHDLDCGDGLPDGCDREAGGLLDADDLPF